MKKAFLMLLIAAFAIQCSQKKKSIEFIMLPGNVLPGGRGPMPNVKTMDSLKQAHDNCMGFAFAANASLIQRKDSLFVGNIINRQTLAAVGNIRDLGLTEMQMMRNFNLLTNPCYEKRVIHAPMKFLLGEKFSVNLPQAGEKLMKELNDAIAASSDAEMQTGSWVYLDMKDLIKNIVDTAQSEKVLRYRNNLLDTSNMVLTAIESVTDVSFLIETKTLISEPLLAILKTKPQVPGKDPRTTMHLYYISDTSFEISINGFFPVIGQFMKAELK
jgi:hypothetical protein